ncbi:uncharacterized protein V1510DRAFT_417772 [Dipodascopsis tothii]|uniref:uncharacterized protein n=1 Tax=Dipodascopsis tothii TaxID=44089 RepID=UPI0034CFB509
MSNQSGIQASDALLDAFRAFSSGPERALVVKIENETLVPGAVLPSSSEDHVADFVVLEPHVSDSEAMYVLYRTAPAQYTFISYVPDAAPVRSKMLYASTRNTLQRALAGAGDLSLTLFATDADELTPDGYRRFLAHNNLAAPLTEEERALRTVREFEAVGDAGAAGSARRAHAGGVAMPMSASAEGALAGLAEAGPHRKTLVVLEIDVAAEKLELVAAIESDGSDLTANMVGDSPRYTFFLYEHEHAGQTEESLVFIYTCPPTARIKERMLYASARAAVLAEAERLSGLRVAKKLEASDSDEIAALSPAALHKELHPPKETTRAAFARPKAPGRRPRA